MDTWYHKGQIRDQLERLLPRLSGTLLDVGCGDMLYREMVLGEPGRVTRYVGLDLQGSEYVQTAPDLTWDGSTIPLDDNSIDCVLATELLEHCPNPEAVLREIGRVLAPGGVLLVTVPFLWPIHDPPHDEYRFTPFAIERLVASGGLDVATLEPFGGWDASLAQMVGLWVRRRPMPRCVRGFLSVLAWPAVCMLARFDRGAGDFRKSSVMIAGLACVAVKPPAIGLAAAGNPAPRGEMGDRFPFEDDDHAS